MSFLWNILSGQNDRKLDDSTLNLKPEQELIVQKLEGWLRISSNYLNQEGFTVFNDSMVQRIKKNRKFAKKKANRKHLEPFASIQNKNSTMEETIFFCKIHNDNLEIYVDEPGSLPKDFTIRRRQSVASPIPSDQIHLRDYSALLYPPELAVGNMFDTSFPVLLKSNFNNSENYYLYFSTKSDKEDWFLRLQNICSHGSQPRLGKSVFSKERGIISELLNKIKAPGRGDTSTNWFNAFVGRIFTSVRSNGQIIDWASNLIQSKLSSIKIPNYVGDVTLKSIELGDSLPSLFNAHLLDLNDDGSIQISADILYNGGFKAEIEAVAFINATVTTISIPMELSCKVLELSGKVLFKLKQYPSDRIWFGFYEPGPKITFDIIPTVWDKSLNVNAAKNAIEKRIMQSIQDTMVLPQLSDILIPFSSMQQPNQSEGPSSASLEPQTNQKRIRINSSNSAVSTQRPRQKKIHRINRSSNHKEVSPVRSTSKKLRDVVEEGSVMSLTEDERFAIRQAIETFAINQ